MRKFVFARSMGVRVLMTVTLLAACGLVSAETLVMNDGSVIHGHITTLQNDVYTIRTDTLGTLRVRRQDVRSISFGEEPSPASTTQSPGDESLPGRADLQAVQSQLMQIPDFFSLIQALQNDPEVQAVLSDPEIMNALASGDITALMNDPRIIALTRNANMREIIEELR